MGRSAHDDPVLGMLSRIPGMGTQESRHTRGMHGAQLIAAFDKTMFDFSFLAAGETQTIILERALSVIPFYYLWLGVRCHNRDFAGGIGTMIVEAFSTLPSDEDPAEFTNTSAPNVFVTITNATVVPSLSRLSAAGMGPMIMVAKPSRARSSALARSAENASNTTNPSVGSPPKSVPMPVPVSSSSLELDPSALVVPVVAVVLTVAVTVGSIVVGLSPDEVDPSVAPSGTEPSPQPTRTPKSDTAMASRGFPMGAGGR